MSSIIREYILLLDILDTAYQRDPQFMRTEQFDKINDRMALLWHYLTETEMNFIKKHIKETKRPPVNITREDLGLHPK